MIYNLVEYLRLQLPTLNFIANGWDPDSEQNSIVINDTGGDPNHWIPRTDWAIQIISRANSVTLAKEQADTVYNLLKNKIGITLPQVTVNDIVYKAVKTYQISPMQTPGYLGADEKHLEMFSFNIVLITK
jgi:maltose-binding protein MalE